MGKSCKPNLEDALNERIRTVLAEGTKHPLEPEIIHKLDEIMNDAKTQN